jgi:hypothetical protein
MTTTKNNSVLSQLFTSRITEKRGLESENFQLRKEIADLKVRVAIAVGLQKHPRKNLAYSLQ